MTAYLLTPEQHAQHLATLEKLWLLGDSAAALSNPAIAMLKAMKTVEHVDLRDMMAASLVLPADLSRNTGRLLAGSEPADGFELIKWWARAKARMRYIEVDAMLEAREL